MARVVAVLFCGLFAVLAMGTAQAQLCSPAELAVDVRNCGTCGRDCRDGFPASNWACNAGQCQFTGCQSGFYDLDGNNTCEYACTFTSAQESCNGVDDDCDGQIDETPVVPTVQQVCGVSPLATTPECSAGGGGVTLACQSGSWQCTFPANVCNGGNCAATAEVCDGLDNDCDGRVNENVPLWSTACASDDGLPPPGDGLCRATGNYVCNGPNAVVCSGVSGGCAALPGGCTESCNNIDDDCDGLVDEGFNNKGAGAGFVQPAVTKVAVNLWIYQYEASRAVAASDRQGRGNGYVNTATGVTGAPIGEQFQRTPVCSQPGRLPWTGVTPREAEQICQRAGGTLCSRAQLQLACTPNAACLYGYNPRGGAGTACNTSFTASKFCNLSPSYDSDVAASGDQDDLLTSGDAALLNCWSDWSGLQGNTGANNRLFDITGNAREITKEGVNSYFLLGGSFLHRSESGAQCSATNYAADQDYRYFDAGFRCCFGSDPTL